MRRGWVGLWLAACASGSGPEGTTSVVSVGPGSASTSDDGGASSSGTTGSEGGSEGGSSEVGPSEEGSTVDDGSSGEPPMECGNALVEVGEECDDADDDPCNGCDACLRRTFLVLGGGRGHLVEIADAAGAPLQLLDTPLTVEAWMRIDGADEEVQIARRGAGNSGWRLGLQASGLIATVFNEFDHFVGGVAPGWHHVAWTYDLASSRLYLDGTLVGEMVASAAVLATDAPLRLGAKIDGTGVVFGYAAGRVDEVRVSSSVRYPEPFVPARRHEADATTVLLLHLDEGEGGSVIDASANGHAATAVGMSWALDDGYGGCE